MAPAEQTPQNPACRHRRMQVGGYARPSRDASSPLGNAERRPVCMFMRSPSNCERTLAADRACLAQSQFRGSQASWKRRLIASAGPDCDSCGLSYARPQHRHHHPVVDGIPVANTSVPPGRHTATERAQRVTYGPGRLHAAPQCEAQRLRRSGRDPDPIVWIFPLNKYTKNRGVKGIRTPDLLHAMQHGFV
jgi:hypothetical protein